MKTRTHKIGLAVAPISKTDFQLLFRAGRYLHARVITKLREAHYLLGVHRYQFVARSDRELSPGQLLRLRVMENQVPVHLEIANLERRSPEGDGGSMGASDAVPKAILGISRRQPGRPLICDLYYAPPVEMASHVPLSGLHLILELLNTGQTDIRIEVGSNAARIELYVRSTAWRQVLTAEQLNVQRRLERALAGFPFTLSIISLHTE